MYLDVSLTDRLWVYVHNPNQECVKKYTSQDYQFYKVLESFKCQVLRRINYIYLTTYSFVLDKTAYI